MEKPPPDPAKMFDAWMAWERGETPPGRTLADLKIAGLREVLEKLAAEVPAGDEVVDAEDAPATESWTPVV